MKSDLKIIFVFAIILSFLINGCSSSSSLDETTAGNEAGNDLPYQNKGENDPYLNIQKQISSPFEYSGYSSPEYNSFEKWSEYVTMSDKTRLAVDVFLPSDGPEISSFPVVFIFTAYDRSMIDPKTGDIYDYAQVSLGDLLLSHGYAIVAADMRGTGASFGIQIPFSPIIGRDGKELIDWMVSQDWCDGNVGMYGGSYLGWSQFVTARNKPEALKCIIPEVIVFEPYTGGFRPGGIAASNWIKTYSIVLKLGNMNFSVSMAGGLVATPVIDEDNDGELADEIPMMDQGLPITFLDDIFIYPFEPIYPDGEKHDSHTYFRATLNHLFNPTFNLLSFFGPYIDSYSKLFDKDMTFIIDGSPGYMLKEIMDSGIAVYNMGRWFDGFAKGTPRLYATMKEGTPSKLLIGPGFHQGMSEAYYEYFSYSGEMFIQLNIERLRFFDRYLKGIENGIDIEPPVYLYVMNHGWRSENEWPLERQEITNFYFDKENRLSDERIADGYDDYDVDFTHRSSYGSTESDRWIMIGIPDSVMKRTEKDAQCFTYDTHPLTKDTEVTGHPIVDLWVTSNQKYGDFFVYLVDVDPDGESIYVTEGRLRAGWHQLQNDDDQINGVLDVKPDLPWHGYKKEQWEDGVLDEKVPLNLKFDMLPTSWVFKEGHRIRVAIAGADHINFELNPGLAPFGFFVGLPPTTITVHRTEDFPSHIELPVIPEG